METPYTVLYFVCYHGITVRGEEMEDESSRVRR